MYSNRLHMKHLTHLKRNWQARNILDCQCVKCFFTDSDIGRCSTKIELLCLGIRRSCKSLPSCWWPSAWSAKCSIASSFFGNRFVGTSHWHWHVDQRVSFSFAEHRRAYFSSWKPSSIRFHCFGHSSSIRSSSFTTKKSMPRASSVLFRAPVICSSPGPSVLSFSLVRFVWRRSFTRDACRSPHVFASFLWFCWWWSVVWCIIGIFSTIQVLYKVSRSTIRIARSPIATCSSAVNWAISPSVVFNRRKTFPTMPRLWTSSFRPWFHLPSSPRRTLWLYFVS